jgi:hypothetical protein
MAWRHADDPAPTGLAGVRLMGLHALGVAAGPCGPPAAAVAVPLLCDYLQAPDVSQVRAVCHAWRAAVDKNTPRLAAFAPPPPPMEQLGTAPATRMPNASAASAAGAAGSSGSTKEKALPGPPSEPAGARPCALAAGARALSCTLPLCLAPATGRTPADPPTAATAAAGPARATVPRVGWVQRAALGLPGLVRLEVTCSLPGWEDLHRLRQLPALRHVTLLEFPFGSGPGRAAPAPGNGPGLAAAEAVVGALAQTVGPCTALCTLCLQSDAVSAWAAGAGPCAWQQHGPPRPVSAAITTSCRPRLK